MTKEDPNSLVLDVESTRYYAEKLSYPTAIDSRDVYWVISDAPISLAAFLGQINARHTKLSDLTQLMKEFNTDPHIIACAGSEFCSAKGDWVGALTQISAPCMSEIAAKPVLDVFLKVSGLLAKSASTNFMAIKPGVAARDFQVSLGALN